MNCKSLICYFFGFLALSFSLKAQPFTTKDINQLAGASYTPHVFHAVSEQVQVTLDETLLKRGKGDNLYALTLLLDRKEQGKKFPGTIFDGPSEKLVAHWLETKAASISPLAVAISQPLTHTTRTQPISFAEKVPENLYQQLRIEWPTKPKASMSTLAPKENALNASRIWEKLPPAGQFAVVVLLLPANEKRQVPAEHQEQPAMLIFF